MAEFTSSDYNIEYKNKIETRLEKAQDKNEFVFYITR